MSKYSNICLFLHTNHKVTSTQEDCDVRNQIVFTCAAAGHVNELKATTFANKKRKVASEDFCETCKQVKLDAERTEAWAKDVKEKTGHIIQTVNWSSRTLVYKCGTCGQEGNSHVTSFERSGRTKHCVKCQNVEHRLTYDQVREAVETHGMVLLTKPEEYVNNKQKLNVLCQCGGPHAAVLQDIKDGKSCMQCKNKKYEQTCMERYGVKNVAFIFKIEK